jgi:hypothetical protein
MRADRTCMQRPNGSGSIGQAADSDPPTAAKSVQSFEALAPTQSVAALTHRVNRLTEEVSEARQRGERLEAALEKSTRRVQQLIGERDRLCSPGAMPSCSGSIASSARSPRTRRRRSGARPRLWLTFACTG